MNKIISCLIIFLFFLMTVKTYSFAKKLHEKNHEVHSYTPSYVCKKEKSFKATSKCLKKTYSKMKKNLHVQYKHFIDTLDKKERQQLKYAQQTWKRYKKANCAFITSEFNDKKVKQSALLNCYAMMSDQRLSQLKQQYQRYLNFS